MFGANKALREGEELRGIWSILENLNYFSYFRELLGNLLSRKLKFLFKIKSF